MRPRVTAVGLVLVSRSADHFTYPAHIDRASLDALPAGPGVYFFRNKNGDPVYIGKSINIRSRVLTHLRTPEEAAMLEASAHVDFRRTAGEIGALLLESRLIKQYQPFYNVLLKETAEAFALYLREDDRRPQAVCRSDVPADEAACLYGMFASPTAAWAKLHELARQHALCPALLGLEATTHGRACFAHQLRHCRGACVGKESAAEHRYRLHKALCLLNTAFWPYDGPIGIAEREGGWQQVHVIDHWSYIGTLEGRRRHITTAASTVIDMDTYKILIRPLAEGRLTLLPCRASKDKHGVRYSLAAGMTAAKQQA